MEEYKHRTVKARVVSQKGTCVVGHKVGDEFIISTICPENMCAWAFNSLFPYIQVLLCDGSFPWEPDPQKCTAACSDPSNPVVFELTREK